MIKATPVRVTYPIPMNQGGMLTGGNAAALPSGPSFPNRFMYPLIPSVSTPFISTTRNTRVGRGIVVPVTAQAGTATLITHGLGRIPQRIQAFLNDGGALVNPAMTLAAGVPPTRMQAMILGNFNMVNCLVYLE